MKDERILNSTKKWIKGEKTPDRQKKIPVGARFSAPVQTGPGASPAPCTMGTGSFSGVKRRSVAFITHPI
jgi:hypothetical protein